MDLFSSFQRSRKPRPLARLDFDQSLSQQKKRVELFEDVLCDADDVRWRLVV